MRYLKSGNIWLIITTSVLTPELLCLAIIWKRTKEDLFKVISMQGAPELKF